MMTVMKTDETYDGEDEVVVDETMMVKLLS